MILDKVFGVYIAPFSKINTKVGKGDTIQAAKTSSIRFGGFNNDYLNKEISEQIWVHTIDTESWEIPLQ
jgi:hypothetical protein